MSDVSTRIWLDEQLWAAVTNRAVTEGTTVRELIPQLVNRSLTVAAVSAPHENSYTAPAAQPDAVLLDESLAVESDLPVVPLSDVYRCGVCGAEVRLGGVSNHLGKHKKEREASEAERS